MNSVTKIGLIFDDVGVTVYEKLPSRPAAVQVDLSKRLRTAFCDWYDIPKASQC